MARQDFGKRDDERFGRSSEQHWNREDEGRDDMEREGRQFRGREYQQGRQSREPGREREQRGQEGQQDWRREQGQHQGQTFGAGAYGGERYGETRYGGGYQDYEERERSQGFGDRGWETSGLGGPRTYPESGRRQGGSAMQGGSGMYGGSGSMGQNYGESGTYGGSSMYGGSYGAGMMGETADWRRQDEYGSGGRRQRGRFFGRGPKGYKRSDERIREDVNEALFRDEHVDASEIEIEVREGEVTLSGTVDSREARRMAEDCVWAVSGVKNVTNMMRVDTEHRAGNGEDWKHGTEESQTRRAGQKKTT